MFYKITLLICLTVFLSGVTYRIFGWVHRPVGPIHPEVGTGDRIAAALHGLGRTLFSFRVFPLIKAVCTEVLLQLHFLRRKKNYYVWSMHICLFWGFILLLLMHALQAFVSERLFGDYQPTLNPFFFLRDLFGFMVLLGLVMALLRRYRFKSTLPPKSTADRVGLTLLALIILSGFLLESVKITSPSAYEQMVADYAGDLTVEEATALEAYWVKAQGLVSSHVASETKLEVFSLGAQIHQQACLDCHAHAQWAFAGYALSRLIRPLAPALDRLNFTEILWHFHFLACFAGLAALPFSRMFHVIATPFSMLVNAVGDPDSPDPATLANRFSLERDGCRHGGACNPGCGVQNKRNIRVDAQSVKEPLHRYLEHHLKVKPDGG